MYYFSIAFLLHYYTMDVLHQRLYLLLKDKIPYDHLHFGCYPYSMFIQDYWHKYQYSYINGHRIRLTIAHTIYPSDSLSYFVVLHELSDLQSEIYSHRLTLNILVVPTSRTYFQNEFLVHCHFETQPFELLVCLIAWIDYIPIAKECISSSFTYLTIRHHRQAD